MNLTARDRKLLWAKAGNSCSYRFDGRACDQRLVQSSSGADVVVGEECHIIGEKPGSARYRSNYAGSETYANAILLCPTHHKMVDDTPTTYTVDTLRQMKAQHEADVAASGGARSDRIEIADSEFVTDVSNADRAVGMEVNRPATLTNVKSTVRVTGNVKEAIAFKTNQGLTSRIDICPSCRRVVPPAHTGPSAGGVRCPHCGGQVPIS